MSARKITTVSMLLAASLIVGLIENLIPPIVPLLPYAKIGLSNAVILFTLFFLKKQYAFLILILKCILLSVFTGNPILLLYSLPSGVISLTVTVLLLKTDFFSLPAVSALSATVHNIIQVIIASIITKSGAVFAYIPYFMVFGMLAGFITGIICFYVVKKLGKYIKIYFFYKGF